MSIEQVFAQCEPFDKREVRKPRNDRGTCFGQYVRTMRSKKAHSPRQRRQPTWYAREWLAAKNLRQTDIVARTNYNKGLVSAYVSGARRWNEDVLAAFALAMSVDRADLLRLPDATPNELAEYAKGLDEKRQAKALRIIKAVTDDDAE